MLPALMTSTFLETNALIFGISAIISGVASVLRIPKDFLFKFLFLEVGGIQPLPRPLPETGKPGMQAEPTQSFSPTPGPCGDAESRGLCLLKQDLWDRGGGFSVVRAQDSVLKSSASFGG